MNLRKKKKLYLFSMGSLAAALLVTGCGSSSGSEPLSKSEFIQEATAICAEAEAERQETFQQVSDEKPTVEDITNSTLPGLEKMLEELGDLGPPPKDNQKVTKIIRAYEAGIEKIEADPENLVAVINTFTDANKLALEYGLSNCSI